MVYICDFRVKYDPEKDTMEDVGKRILYTLFIKRINANKPAITEIFGGSGEGKSESTIRLLQVLFEIQGIELNEDNFIKTNVFYPLEYPEKLEKLLTDPECKHLNALVVHEARTIVSAKLWQSFVNQAISDVNAMSRAVKKRHGGTGLCFFIITQSPDDITKDVRKTLTYMIEANRPIGHSVRFKISVNWKDMRDLENIKLRKRKVRGELILPNGKRLKYNPDYFEMRRPPKHIVELFDKMDTDFKMEILRQKFKRLIEEMRKDMGVDINKVEKMVDFYHKNPEGLSSIGKLVRGKWKISEEACGILDLDKKDVKKFEALLQEKFKQEIIEDIQRGDDEL